MAHDIEREADAAAFEDWSVWEQLDGKPRAPRPRPLRDGAPRIYSRYYCQMSPNRARFEIYVPPNVPIDTMVRRLPGVYRTPRATREGCYSVPAEHWRALRAALPAIKAAVVAWVAQYDAEATVLTRGYEAARRALQKDSAK